jgi:hypothetical protein
VDVEIVGRNLVDKSEQIGKFTLQAFKAIFIFHLLKLCSGTDDPI